MAGASFATNATVLGFAGLTAAASLYDTKIKSELLNQKIKDEATSTIYKMGMTQQQISELDHQLSLVMSEEDIQALKDQAFAKAYTASQGLSGTTSTEIQGESKFTKSLAQGKSVGQTRDKQRQFLGSMLYDKMRFEQTTRAAINQFGDPLTNSIRTFTNTLGGGLTALNWFGQSEQNKFIGTV